jgi:arginyl-tRNA synthetase
VQAVRSGALGAGVDETVVAEAPFSVERPKQPQHGDLATNIAMVLTKKIGRPPRDIANALVKALEGSHVVRTAEVAGPGFVNVRVHPDALHRELEAILDAGAAYGRAPAATGERIDVEFVSANPTGPVTVASGRNAIYGDAVARLLEATGNRVTREYYINDRGNQVRALAESVRAAWKGLPPPEDGYAGPYVKDIATHLRPRMAEDASIDDVGRNAVSVMLRGVPGNSELPGIRRSLANLGVFFDVWFSEESLHRWGAVDAVMDQLHRDGFLEKQAPNGPWFFKAKEGSIEDKDREGQEVDRVVRKSDGSWAYFASDIAYLADKISRGYDRLVYVLGADHHGALPRLKNAMTALGLPVERFEALLYQLVFIRKGGELVKSSKRAGNFVTIDEVMDEIDAAAGKGAGADALRFFFLSRSANSNVDFDIDLAK